MSEVYLIAEIGVNHNGSLAKAIELIDAAKNSRANAVKFQTFSADTLVGRDVPKVKYQLSTTDAKETHYQMIKKLEFSKDDHIKALAYCEEIGIDFISTPYDVESVSFLKSIGVKTIKIASADIVDFNLLKAINKSNFQHVILSTGMATIGEVDEALQILNNPNSKVTLLQCTSNYPCSDSSINLRVMSTLQTAFGLDVGFSDHSIGTLAASISVTLGASIVEKHFTLDKNLEGPDHKASSTPSEFRKLVDAVRRTETILGNPIKRVQEEEMQMRAVSRKSISAAKNLKSGDVIAETDLIMLRPGTGLHSKMIPSLIGSTVTEDILQGEAITLSKLRLA